MAMANEKVSRPQPCSYDSGVRNWPIAERGPKAMSEIAQPTAISTIGVRHDWSFAGVDAVAVDMSGPGDAAAGIGTVADRYLVIRRSPPKRKFVMTSICAAHGCMAGPPGKDNERIRGWMEGTGAAPAEVLYDLLEVRITGLEMPAASRMFSSPNMLNLSILENTWRKLQCRFWTLSAR